MRVLLIIILNVLRIIDIIAGTIVVLATMMGGNWTKGCIWLIFCVVIYLLVSKVLEVVYSTYTKPISQENVVRFYQIGKLMFWFAILDAIIQYRYYSPFAFFKTVVGSIKISSVIYLIIALLLFLIAEIIQDAI